MDYLSLIRRPIETSLDEFISMFNEALTHDYGLLASALNHIRQRGGKRMRPMLMLLMAKQYGGVGQVTLHSAVGLELLHTASLVHDDVVDESSERRGQPSVNASYNNQVAVLVGDYILSTALLHVAKTGNRQIVENLARLGRTLAAGEILQLSNVSNEEISEEVYFQVISQKTAALFEACSGIGALSANASESDVSEAVEFGRNLGIMFQIKDDIFDYFSSTDIGKPTGSDMAEGKLTLPLIYALQHTSLESMLNLARKAKHGMINADEIAVLVDFTKESGGIEYAEQVMNGYRDKCLAYIDSNVTDHDIREALTAYVNFVIDRKN